MKVQLQKVSSWTSSTDRNFASAGDVVVRQNDIYRTGKDSRMLVGTDVVSGKTWTHDLENDQFFGAGTRSAIWRGTVSGHDQPLVLVDVNTHDERDDDYRTGRGVVALDAKTGAVRWRHDAVPLIVTRQVEMTTLEGAEKLPHRPAALAPTADVRPRVAPGVRRARRRHLGAHLLRQVMAGCGPRPQRSPTGHRAWRIGDHQRTRALRRQ
ncbi:hypothetical protein [Yimella sp. cx-51]|uniref:hypothetical protein n=1 Tax=Yimella sp. cx-51 TaxID=2770551 RepID=UPI00165DD75F|nr:hypothetical protein [Yimella sp. cx-51]MBC9957961.1 hypothetical protein [Yimella sp. cx-51]QTH38091.1 hypothetical protein J5M86_14895 [Yimella sp. cx-51]